MEAFGAALFSKEQNFPWPGGPNDSCRRLSVSSRAPHRWPEWSWYFSQISPRALELNFLCRIRPLTQGWAGIAVPGHFREYWPPTSVPKARNGIFHSHSVPENWEGNFPLAFPKIGNGIPVTNFHLHSRSRKSGMEFSTCIPVCENWKWNFPLTFPFPKFENGIGHSRSSSQSPKVIPTHPWFDPTDQKFCSQVSEENLFVKRKIRYS